MPKNNNANLLIIKSLSDMFSDSFVIKTISDNSSDSIYFKDMNGRFIYVNKMKAEHNGVSDPFDMIGKTDYEYFLESDADKITIQDKRIIETGQPIVGQIEKFIRLDGRISWVSVSKSPIFDTMNQIIGIWGISRDVTESEMAKEEIIFNENKYRIMIENVSDIIEIIDIDGMVKYISPNAQRVFDWGYEDIVGQSCFKNIHPDDQELIQKKFHDIIGKPGTTSFAEFRVIDKDGSCRYIELSGRNLLHSDFIEGILLNYHDISDRKEQENRIHFLSYHDVLTNLYNRAFFEEEKLRLDTASQLPLSIIVGDVNGLKLTNDAYGHVEGDKLLVEVARILKKCCRKEEIIARVGGDEFYILLPQIDFITAQKICNRIYKSCKDYRGNKNNSTIQPSISLGNATKTIVDQSLDQIIKDAEDFMYQHKLLERDTTHSSVMNSIQATMHESSNETEEHSDRMIKLSLELGKVLRLQDEQLLELDLLSRLHDVGKICINENILTKPGKLNDDEWAKIKQHPEVGFRIAQASAELIRISHLILSHHERWDGKGYPQGLSGTGIPLLSRIIAVVDAYDAMTQDRPYRKAMPKEAAINEIFDNSNKQFDPEIAKIFIEKVIGEPWKRH